ncbi:hypothetical protein NL388_32210, partial [Klebsiella pneumoniae]|nr:hypothetical protein [Klebsiella pneumoniae]
EQAVAEQEQAIAQEQAQQQPQRQPRETREQFIERKKAESMNRYGVEPTDEQLEAAWKASTEQDGVLLDDGTVIGRAEFYEVMRPYLS